VHFICREVLYQYLLNHLTGDGWGPRLKKLLAFDLSDGIDEEEKNELKTTISPDHARLVLELVKPLKCCDPAVGSGAFPVGLMQELVNLRRLLETVLNGYRDPVLGPQGSTWLHDAKGEIVENCLYGVDIQQQAIEICRLRLWLSLVVDYDLGLDPFTAEYRQFSESINHISQLPNLEMNFRRGDSLHDHISGVPVVILPDRASQHATEFAAIAKLGADLHKAKRAERKKRLRLDILQKRLELSRKIVDEELRIIRERDSAFDRLFSDDEESDADKRRRNKREIERLEEALNKIEADQKELEKLRRREADAQFYPKLRKLEGADFDSPFNFAWSIDFPGFFLGASGGFDIAVGNPPFVTARNKIKRELWRSRWPRVCHQKYQLLAPFLECGFALIKPDGELGFIISNAFAKRDFGQPLVERLFSTVKLQKVVDCSGLLFPGHGTPTCIIFGARATFGPTFFVRVAALLPGGGDLRTPPEESFLWRTLEAKNDQPGYVDTQVIISDRLASELATFPWSLEAAGFSTRVAIETSQITLGAFAESVGPSSLTRSNEVFVQPLDLLRRFNIEKTIVRPFFPGDSIRNYSVHVRQWAIVPYTGDDYRVIALDSHPRFKNFVLPYREYLENVIVFGKPKKETGKRWYEFTDPYPEKNREPKFLPFAFIATHNHFVFNEHPALFPQSAPVVKLPSGYSKNDYRLLSAICNSSTALFWLKQVAYNKGAGEDEHRDRFEFSGRIVESLPLPHSAANCLRGKNDEPCCSQLLGLCANCLRIGTEIASLDLHYVFAHAANGYEAWYEALDGVSQRHDLVVRGFTQQSELRSLISIIRETRERATSLLIARQEEIDWLIYGAYGLLAQSDPAVHPDITAEELNREERPFRLWERGESKYERAIDLIPKEWPAERRKLWEARLNAIRDNEHVRRVEQPVYKRRWDEQWKVGNRWRCGEIAYAAEFTDAFEWWLKEKAEWWLEHKKNGGPVELSEWTQALWKDERVQAAWPVAAEQYVFVGHEEEGDPVPAPPQPPSDFSGFASKFKEVIEEETVPDGFPFGMDYDELENKLKKSVPKKLKNVRGKLNVPRERFHSVAKGQYKWAGLQFRSSDAKR